MKHLQGLRCELVPPLPRRPASSNDVPDPDDELAPFDLCIVGIENLFEPEAEFAPDSAASEPHPSESFALPSRVPRTLLPCPEQPPLLAKRVLRRSPRLAEHIPQRLLLVRVRTALPSNTTAYAFSRLCPMIPSDSDSTWLADCKADPIACAQHFPPDGSFLPTTDSKHGRIWRVDHIVVPASGVQGVIHNHISSVLTGH